MAHKEWYYMQQDGQPSDPLSGKELYKLARSGVLTPEMLVRNGAEGRWLAAGRVRNLFDGAAIISRTEQDKSHDLSPVSSPENADHVLKIREKSAGESVLEDQEKQVLSVQTNTAGAPREMDDSDESAAGYVEKSVELETDSFSQEKSEAVISGEEDSGESISGIIPAEVSSVTDEKKTVKALTRDSDYFISAPPSLPGNDKAVSGFSSNINFPGMIIPAAPPASDLGKKMGEDSEESESIPDSTERKHWLDQLLNLMRHSFSVEIVNAAGEKLTLVGHAVFFLGFLTSVASIFIFPFLNYGIVMRICMMLGFTGIFFAFRYVAYRVFSLFNYLNNGSACQLSSTLLSDCVGLSSVMMGVFFLVLCVAQGLAYSQYYLILFGLGGFIFTGYTALVALHPDILNFTVTQKTHPEDEAVNTLVFFLKLMLRVSPAGYLSCALSALGIMVHCFILHFSASVPISSGVSVYLILSGSEFYLVDLSLRLWFIAGILPLAVYLIYIFLDLFFSLLRAILIVPRKLDMLRDPHDTP